MALKQVAGWGNLEETKLLTLEEHEARQVAREELKKWTLFEETSWTKIQGALVVGRGQKHCLFSYNGQCPREKKLPK